MRLFVSAVTIGLLTSSTMAVPAFAGPDDGPSVSGNLGQWTNSICVMASMVDDLRDLKFWLPRAVDGGRCSSRPDVAGSYMAVVFGIYDSDEAMARDSQIGSNPRACCGTGPYALGYIPDDDLYVMFVSNREFPRSGFRPLEQFGFIIGNRTGSRP